MDSLPVQRLKLGHFPTPLEFLPRLSKHLGGPNIFIKRDDCTGVAGGGNKVRKLEFLLADALAQGANTIVTQGAIQSNHVRQTAALCAKLGLACHLLLEDRTGQGDAEFYANGNVMLSQLLGADIEIYPGGTDMNAMMARKANALKTNSGATSPNSRMADVKPYIIPGGGSNAIGGLGYVAAAQELIEDAQKAPLRTDHIIHATGSTGTQSGLVAGLQHLGSNIEVTGISVRYAKSIQTEKVLTLAQEIHLSLGNTTDLPKQSVMVDDRFIGEGYGIPGPDTLEAIKLFAQTEGILLDPVYTGKAAAGLLQLCAEGSFTEQHNVVFLHTGGAQSLPGYRPVFDFPTVPTSIP